MPDKLTPPIRYDRQKDRSSKRKRGTVMPEGGGKIIRPQKGLGFNELKKSFFITGAFDIPFFALTIIILAIGLVMLFSASYPYSYFESGNSYHYFIRQLIFAVMGVVAMLVISKINYKVFKAAAPYLLGLTLFYLCLFFFITQVYLRKRARISDDIFPLEICSLFSPQILQNLRLLQLWLLI